MAKTDAAAMASQDGGLTRRPVLGARATQASVLVVANGAKTEAAARANTAAGRGGRGIRPAVAGLLAAALSTVGVFSILSTALFLWALWVNDPLKSIGGLVPVVSLILILRVWQSLGWEMRGTWWGLALLAGTIALVHLRDHAIMELVLTPSWAIFWPPHSLVAVCYTAGAVLLFGGVRLLRAAVFPVVLTWFVNPVPNFFTLHVDLPLQHVSSLIARAFAHGLGEKLSPDQLRLMFTPQFGMFIAPGCNGIRGAVTMGFIALIAGYLYKFRPRVTALVVAGAVLLGYVFNLVRLCFLVLYYIVALHLPWLQTRAAMGDYVIGACLFFFATGLLFVLIQRLGPSGDLRIPRLARAPEQAVPRTFWMRWAAFAVLIALGSITYARALANEGAQPRYVTDPQAMGLFPQQIGSYKLVREWNEYLEAGGPLIYYWGDYAPIKGSAAAMAAGVGLSDAGDKSGDFDGGEAGAGDSGVVSVGISPVLGAHDTLICHAARGEDWLWHGDMWLPTQTGKVSFSGSFYNNGASQYLEATTVCTGATCGQYSSSRKHFGFIYSRPDTRTVLSQSPTRPIPILLRSATLNTAMAATAARAELTANMQRFLAAANLAEFTRPYR